MSFFKKSIAFYLIYKIIIIAPVFYLTGFYGYFRSPSSKRGYNSDAPEVKPETLNEVYIERIFKSFKGIYIGRDILKNKERFNQLVSLSRAKGLNTLVIDIKDVDGFVNFKTKNAYLKNTGFEKFIIKNGKEFLKELNDFYLIARISVFKDGLMYEKKENWRLIRTDEKNWLDPENTNVWAYNLELMLEAFNMGFDEVQFDYIRYPPILKKDDMSAPLKIAEFLKNAKIIAEIKQKKISADIFGLIGYVPHTMGIGQEFSAFYENAHFISNMVYPSHYGEIMFGSCEETLPYKTVKQTLAGIIKNHSPDLKKIRPWIQDFSLSKKYTKKEVAQQINALKENNIDSFLLWNQKGNYSYLTD